MLDKLKAFFDALNKGKTLASPAGWKTVQIATPAIAAVLVFGLTFFPSLGLTPDDIETIAKTIAIIGVLINGYLTVATTDKLGLPSAANGVSINGSVPNQDSGVLSNSSLDTGPKATLGNK